MGIRYFALAVPAPLVERASSTPVREFIQSEPWGDPYDLDREDPLSLDLDKAWRDLQGIFGPAESATPAYELVRGDVTHTDMGWIPFQRFLSPDQVRAVAADLADTDECFVMDAVAARRKRPNDTFEQEVEYALHHLENAKTFVNELVKGGAGLVYWIG